MKKLKPTHKICSVCRRLKILSKFYKRANGGPIAACAVCSARKKNSKNSDRILKGLCAQCGAKRGASTRYCIRCKLAKNKNTANAYPAQATALRAYHRQKSVELKIEMLTNYGLACACCSVKQFEFLSLDHINNDGAAHRKLVGGGVNMYRWLKKNGFPKIMRTLCMNCNFSVGKYGYCPHTSPGLAVKLA